MEIGTVIASTVSVNRDGETPVRLVTCTVSGPTDIRTIQLITPFGDANPIVGSRLLILPAESAWEFGIMVEDVLASAAVLIGDKVLAANTPAGITAYVAARAATGFVELNGTSDTAVAFTQMKAAFDTLRTELTALVTAFNTHKHTGVTAGAVSSGPTDTPGVPPVADMTAANVSTVKVLLP
jgi:hypothetical protein